MSTAVRSILWMSVDGRISWCKIFCCFANIAGEILKKKGLRKHSHMSLMGIKMCWMVVSFKII